ncbi:MAG: endopeptidase La [Bacillota bacterium]|nr:endopeptidase La [Bacillota bacterium]
MSEINIDAISSRMPLLPLRGLTIFPNMLLNFDVGREKSIKALEWAMHENQLIFLVAQKDIKTDSPQREDLCKTGTISRVRQLLRLPGDSIRVLVEGIERAHIESIEQEEPFYLVDAVMDPEPKVKISSTKKEALIRHTQKLFEEYAGYAPKMTDDTLLQVASADNIAFLADYIAQNIAIRHADKQAVLDELNPVGRINLIMNLLGRETGILKVESNIQNKVTVQIDKNQKDYYLREQMKVIQEELGDHDDVGAEVEEYLARIEALHLPEEMSKKLENEAYRLSRLQYTSPESGIIRTYLDICLDLPWNKETKERTDLKEAARILDRDHYGLTKVKERILEFLAVKKLTNGMTGQILCLVGPPGIGKTSIAKSIAQAMGRKYARLSLGGVRDEADIRGHRKTYIGAMPGRIITAVSQAGSRNCLIVLDEIDKLGNDFRGDPSSALLEVLDTEQNNAFRDHFVELPFDLSSVLFLTTANTTETISRPLLDRMEVIELSGYIDEEKLQIAKRHLIPKQFKKHGLNKTQIKIDDEAVRRIISEYTREAGVRKLENEIARICRKVAKLLASGEIKKSRITASDLDSYLGIPKYKPNKLIELNEVGVINGLAWTSTGGELLEVEANVLEGTGRLELTGNLGDVMKESGKAALSYIRSRAKALGIDHEFYKSRDIHIHFPEGAIPKDGPSAGIATASAMISALTGVPTNKSVAMTGEITLRGRVLPIGGLREKTMAAFRAGIKTVIIPEENLPDLDEIDPTVRAALRFVPVSHMDQVLPEILVGSPQLQAGQKEEEAKNQNAGQVIPVSKEHIQPDIKSIRQ